MLIFKMPTIYKCLQMLISIINNASLQNVYDIKCLELENAYNQY